MEEWINKFETELSKILDKEDTLYVFCPYHIGDLLGAGGFVDAAKKMRGKSHAIIFASERVQSMGVSFPGVDKIIYWDQDFLDMLAKYIYTTGRYETHNYIYGHFYRTKDGVCVMNFDINFIEGFRPVFKLSPTAPFLSPTVAEPSEEEMKKIYNDFVIDKKHTVILAPYAKSLPDLPTDLWVNLVKSMQEKGFIVYTNVAPQGETPIAGTKPFSASLTALFALSDKIRAVIDYRSGLFDYLAFSNAKILCISPFPGPIPVWIFSLPLLYPNSDSHMFYYAEEFIKPISEYFCNSGVEAVLKISHPKITEPIYFSKDELIQAIMSNI